MASCKTDQKVLPCPIGRLYMLLKARHEPMPGLDSLLDLRVVDLEQQAELSSNRIANLGDL
jgi:hypothetical protein